MKGHYLHVENFSDEFLESAKAADPERFQEVAERYPTLTKRDYYRIKLGEPISRMQKRRKSEIDDSERPIAKEQRRRLSPDDYEDYRHNKTNYERDWLEDYYRAKELADEGM